VPYTYPPLNLTVRTPRVTLAGATDELLERLVPVVRAGVVGPGALPFDDPMSLYEDSPEREWRWLRAIWSGRGRVGRDWWRLYLVVVVDGEVAGMQDVIGAEFPAFAAVSTFSWLGQDFRGRGIGKEMRAAALHLAFAGLGAREATSDAFTDNHASNGVSQALGYQQNGTDWATRRGTSAQLLRWRLTRERWQQSRRDDIALAGVDECLPVLGLAPPWAGGYSRRCGG
jgi:RimJ/RimL family protein N-acetyltransferase